MPWITKDGHRILVGEKGATQVNTRGGTFQPGVRAYGAPAPGRTGFHSHSTTAVIRAAAAHGLDREQTKSLLTRMNLPAAPNTVYIQHARGKAGEQVPEMAPEEHHEFMGHVNAIQAGNVPKPVGPVPTNVTPVVQPQVKPVAPEPATKGEDMNTEPSYKQPTFKPVVGEKDFSAEEAMHVGRNGLKPGTTLGQVKDALESYKAKGGSIGITEGVREALAHAGLRTAPSPTVIHTGETFGEGVSAAEKALSAAKQQAAEGHHSVAYKEAGTGQFKVKTFGHSDAAQTWQEAAKGMGSKIYGTFAPEGGLKSSLSTHLTGFGSGSGKGTSGETSIYPEDESQHHEPRYFHGSKSTSFSRGSKSTAYTGNPNG